MGKVEESPQLNLGERGSMPVPESNSRSIEYIAWAEERSSHGTTFRQNGGELARALAFWRGAATAHFGPHEVSLYRSAFNCGLILSWERGLKPRV